MQLSTSARHARRRWASVALAVSFALVLAACGGTTKESSGGGATATSAGAANPSAQIKQGLKVAFLPKQLNNPYFTVADAGGLAAVKEFGGEGKAVGPSEASASSQVSYINTLAQQRQDAIVISANDPNAVVPALKAAQGQGVKVVSFDSDTAPEGRQIFVNQNTWIKFMKDELTKPEYKNMKLVKVAYGNDDDQDSFQQTQGLLQAYPNLKGIISPTTVGIAAAARYLSGSEYKGKVALTGLGTPNQMRKFVQDGTVEAFELWDPGKLGYLAAYAAAALASGQISGKEGESFKAGKLGDYKVGKDGEVLLGPPQVFDKDNISQFDF